MELESEVEGLRCCLLKANHAALLPHNAKELKRRRVGLYLPEEVVEEILLRLAPETLLICKLVCKLWNNLITHPSFVNKHLRFTVQNSKLSSSSSSSSSVSLFLKWTRQEISEDDIFNGDRHELDLSKQFLSLVTISEDISANSHSDSTSGDLLPCVIEHFSFPSVPELEQVDLIGSHCNGIICFFDRRRKDTVVWCNPALRKFKIFHTPCLLPDFKSAGRGFGYDPTADVYKYVKIFRSTDDARVCRAQVYTLGSDSWRDIDIDFLPGNWSCCLGHKGVYCNGVYYWCNLAMGYHMILSFDMSEEEFHIIPMPDHAKDVNFKIKSLALWNESVVFFFSPELSWFSTSLEMWVMVEGSTHWTKHLTIGPLACIKCPLEFWRDDELLMETTDGRIVSYNLYTQKLRKLPVPGAVYPGLTYTDLCLKSLVLV